MPSTHERARSNLLADQAMRGLGLSCEDRLVQAQIDGREQAPVSRHLIARREQREVADDDLLDTHGAHGSRRA